MSVNSEMTWAEHASRGSTMRFYQPSKRRSVEAAASSYPLVGSVMFEDDDLKSQILASKAMAIVQQALSSGSVLFSFRKGLFGDRVDAYKIIQTQVSSLVEFRPLSVYDEKNDGSLLIEAKFEEVDNANKATTTGVNVNGMVYKAVHAKECKEFGDLKFVQFTLMRIVKEPTFLHDLIKSLSFYGRVLQVKKFTRGGFLEGKFSVMVDISVGYQVEGGEWQEAQPLDRMLYLSEFDCFVAATYKGAPPVCHFCRHSGHVRAKCPELLQRRCYGCGKHGHMLRFCPGKEDQSGAKKQKVDHQLKDSEEVTEARRQTVHLMDFVAKAKLGAGREVEEKVEEEELESVVDEEEESLQGVVDGVDASENDKSTESDNLGVQMEDLQGEDHQDKLHGDDAMEEDDEIVLAGGSGVKKLPDVRGSAFSKYASNEAALTMNVDSPEEMMGLSKLKEASQRKRMELNANLKAVNGAGVGAVEYIHYDLHSTVHPVTRFRYKLLSSLKFHKDNDPKHTSNLVKDYLQEQSHQIMGWPPQSPDLNPIKNMLALMKRRFNEYETATKGMSELYERVTEIWYDQMKPEDCQKVIESMPRRTAAVIKAKGKWTEY